MKEKNIQANEKERLTYTNILQSYSNRTRVSISSTKRRLKLPNKSVFKICQLCEKFPEEEVLFLYNQNSPLDNRGLAHQRTGEESLLIPNYSSFQNQDGKHFKCNPIYFFYLLFNILLLIYSFILSILLGHLYHIWLNITFSAFALFSIVLIVGLFICGILGIMIYLRITRTDSAMYAYYGLIGFDILLTVIQLITMNWKIAIAYDLFYWIDYRFDLMYGIYGSLLVVEVIDVALHYFFYEDIKKKRRNPHWKNR